MAPSNDSILPSHPIPSSSPAQNRNLTKLNNTITSIHVVVPHFTTKSAIPGGIHEILYSWIFFTSIGVALFAILLIFFVVMCCRVKRRRRTAARNEPGRSSEKDIKDQNITNSIKRVFEPDGPLYYAVSNLNISRHSGTSSKNSAIQPNTTSDSLSSSPETMSSLDYHISTATDQTIDHNYLIPIEGYPEHVEGLHPSTPQHDNEYTYVESVNRLRISQEFPSRNGGLETEHTYLKILHESSVPGEEKERPESNQKSIIKQKPSAQFRIP